MVQSLQYQMSFAADEAVPVTPNSPRLHINLVNDKSR